ncbi:MAG: hypothetical protein ACLPPF_06135 [Rhodomicrobium sp.]
MKMYMDSMEAWKKSYTSLSTSGKTAPEALTAENAKAACDTALASWHKSGEEVYKRFVEQQIEICRFFAARWEQYLKLPAQIAHCQTPADLQQVQTFFLNQFATDYVQETGKLTQPVGELMSHLPAQPHA